MHFLHLSHCHRYRIPNNPWNYYFFSVSFVYVVLYFLEATKLGFAKNVLFCSLSGFFGGKFWVENNMLFWKLALC